MNNALPNTFGINATADEYVVLHDEKVLNALLQSGKLRQHEHLVLGAGSNMVFASHFPGIVVHPDNKGIRLVDDSSPDTLLVEAAAGEVWDDFVQHCIRQSWYGVENLVAIPGTVGAAPVQNVGAYGVEAKDVIHSVRAFCIATGEERIFLAEECMFDYRNSIFKGELSNRYVVWSVTFRLQRQFVPRIGYKAISDALLAAGVVHPTARQLADTITEVRWRKLPRPEEKGSAGSFFKNPIVDAEHYGNLLSQYPDIVAYPVGEGYKLAAGWLIERAGWKGRSLGRCGVYEKQALVLVNHGGCSGSEVVALADAVAADVRQLFGVTLHKEAIIVNMNKQELS